MKSVQIHNISKIYSITMNKNNFKEVVNEVFAGVLSSENKNGRKEFYALKDISFDLEKGDVLGIIGDNGAGKSTLLKIISGVSQPSMGELILEGKISSILEIGTGFHMELSGRENIFLSGSILGMNKEEIRRQYSSIVQFSGLKDFINVAIKRYSSGMYLRLAFSVLAHLNTDIILLDEIIYVGDAEFKMKSYNKIKELARSGKTILIVSHDLASISDLCSKCLMLDKGEAKLFGATSDIVHQYLDKSLSKYMKSSAEDQTSKMKLEMENLEGKISEMDRIIYEREAALNKASFKEQKLISELNKLKEESKEIHKFKKSLEANSESDTPKNAPASEKNWTDEETAPGNNNIKLKRLACTTIDNKTTFTQEDDIQLEIEYWKYIKEPLRIAITASYNFNQIAFGTSSSFGGMDLLNNEGTGLFKNICHINKYLLNHGMFSFSFFFIDSRGVEAYAIHSVLILKIDYDPALYKRFNYTGNLIMPFVPVFKWS